MFDEGTNTMKKKVGVAILFVGLATVIVYFGIVGPRSFLRSFGDGKKEELVKVEEKIAEVQSRLDSLKNLTPEELEERKKRQETLSALGASGDVSVPGVSISEKNGRKVITNSDYGYTIELPASLILARSVASDFLEFHDRELLCGGDPSCPAVIEILARNENPRRLSLEDWLEEEEKKIGDKIYSPREPLAIGGAEAFRVTENIPRIFDGFYYYLSRDSFLYSIRISAVDDAAYRKFINTFKFE